MKIEGWMIWPALGGVIKLAEALVKRRDDAAFSRLRANRRWPF
jgi:hypothetical protein